MNNNTEHNNDSAEEQSSELADLSADHGEDVVGGEGTRAIFVEIDSLEPIDLERPTRTTSTNRTFSVLRNWDPVINEVPRSL